MQASEEVAGYTCDPQSQNTIPVTYQQIGSWQIAISRLPRSTVEITGLYDAASVNWRRTTRRFRLEDAYRDLLLASDVERVLAPTESEVRVLECGVGCGSLSIAMNRILPRRVGHFGIDVSGAMLAEAQAAMREAGLSPRLRQADVRSIPYPDQSFDCVMAAHVVEHLPDPKQALAEMTRVLKPGGILLACVTRRSIFGALIQLHWRTWAITEQQGTEWLRDCQLTDIASRPIALGFFAGQASVALWGRKPVE